MNAVEYAETTLGVHTAYTRAGELHDELVQRQLELETALKVKRVKVESLESKQYETTSELRAVHSDLSDTAFNREVKGWLFNDAKVRAARSDLAVVTSNVEYLEHRVRAVEFDLKIEIARMHELGGYFEYLAAAKNAQAITRTAVADTSPWHS